MTIDFKNLVDEKKFSEITGIAVSTLQKHRMNSRGFPFVRIGGRVRYDLKDIEKHLNEVKVHPTIH